MTSHDDLIRDQFTKQAVPFSTGPSVKDETALRLLVEATRARPLDEALDVACGPGLVACAFARTVRRAEGIDLTPAMIELARSLAREKELSNVSFEVGGALPLRRADESFTIVTARYAFHHFEDPLAVLREMARVSAPGGRVAVADVAASPEPAKAAAFNRMEKLRDPSHVRALTLDELTALFPLAGLPRPMATFYSFESELEGLISRSFPEPGAADEVRSIVLASLRDDGLGMATRRVGSEVLLTYPIAILCSEKPRTLQA